MEMLAAGVPVLLLGAGVVVTVLVRVLLRRDSVGPALRDRRIAWLRTVSGRARWTGLWVGALVCVWIGVVGHLGLGLLLAPAVFAVVQILGLIAGEGLIRNAVRTPGTAVLERREVRDYLPRGLVGCVAAASVLLVGTLTSTTLLAATWKVGGAAGRVYVYDQVVDGVVVGTSRSPWPGSFYSIPAGVVLLVVFALAGVGLVLAVGRPRDGSDPQIRQADDAARSRVVESVVAAVGVAVATMLAGLGLVLGGSLLDIAGASGSTAVRLLGGLAVVIAFPAAVLLTWSLSVLFVPGAGQRAADRRYAALAQ